MTEYVIQVEKLSKSYRIGQQRRERYTALRDVLSNGVKGIGARLLGCDPGRASMHHEEFWALNNLSFDIKPGERVGIIGHNGAGKSTLLKILSRISEPTHGRVVIRGRVACLLEVGTGFHPELTGRENIYLNGAILGMSRGEIRRKFDEIVAFAEVERFLDMPVKHYSSGMYVRLAFAVAAHLEPELLLVDEVLAVGDVQFQKKCLGKMQSFAEQEQRTVIFVSHNMEAIRTLCTTVIHLQGGQLHSIGPAEKEVQAYLHPTQESTPISAANPYHVSPDLTIQQLAMTPAQVVSGAGMQLQLTFHSTTLTSFREIAVIISSATGVRVAVLDLRRADGYHPFDAAGYCSLSVCVKRLPLVEGEYQVGLYLQSTLVGANLLDLAKFTVEPPAASDNGILPYPSQYRGFITLDYTFAEDRTRIEPIGPIKADKISGNPLHLENPRSMGV
jgi:lipopolysaccharide transport system ATP-binding protein